MCLVAIHSALTGILPSSPTTFYNISFQVLCEYCILLSFTSSISWVNSSLLRNDGFQSCRTSQVSLRAVMSETLKHEDPRWEKLHWLTAVFPCQHYPCYIFLPFCFCRKSIVLCKMVDLSILRGWPCPCSMVHSSLMSTLNWSRLFFSDLLRDALQQSTHENN